MSKSLAVITGAGSGIGRATTLLFASKGYQVAICDIDLARCESVAREVGPAAILSAAVDVADRQQMESFSRRVLEQATPDVVINNAGVSIGGEFKDLTIEDWDWLMGINVRGVMLGCHYFVPAMIAAKRGGHIINVSSVFGHWGAPLVSAYAASKFAVLGFSQSLRTELAPHRIGVTAMCPGMIDTNIIDGGRFAGDKAVKMRDGLQKRFRSGTSPDRVASAMFDAIKHNQAVRPVGNDGWMLWAMSKSLPWLRDRLAARVLYRKR
jgi:NADP-dependent 3-hydroxy acid dehydrogenase YdfG